MFLNKVEFAEILFETCIDREASLPENKTLGVDVSKRARLGGLDNFLEVVDSLGIPNLDREVVVGCSPKTQLSVEHEQSHGGTMAKTSKSDGSAWLGMCGI